MPKHYEKNQGFIEKFETSVLKKEQRYDEFMEAYQDNHEIFKKLTSQRFRCQKLIIVFNLIALFLFWAEVKIQSGEVEPQVNSITLFGLNLTGLDNFEVIIGFLCFLFVLHIRLMWIIISECFILSKDNSRKFREIDPTYLDLIKFFKKFSAYENDTDKKINYLNDTNKIINFFNKSKEILLFIYVGVYLWVSVTLSAVSSFKAFTIIKDHFEFSISNFLVPLLFLLLIEFFLGIKLLTLIRRNKLIKQSIII